jgi:copper chaperone CopZ
MKYRAMFGLVSVALMVGCTGGEVPSPVTTPIAFNTAGAPTIEFSAPDMMCPEGCGTKVKEILSGQPGAQEVVIDFDAKTAKVAVEKDGKFDANAAVAALVDHGFKNSAIKSGDSQPATAKP